MFKNTAKLLNWGIPNIVASIEIVNSKAYWPLEAKNVVAPSHHLRLLLSGAL